MNTIRDIFKNILSPPRFVMAVNGKKKKINPYNSSGLIKAF